MAHTKVDSYLSSRVDPGLEDYEKALKMLIERERKQAEIFEQKKSLPGLKGQPRPSVDRLLRSWRKEARSTPPLLPRKPEPRPQDPRDRDTGTRPLALWVRHPLYAPIAFALLATVVASLWAFSVPGSFLSGVFNRVRPSLPLTEESKTMILAYANPLSDDKLSQTLGPVDSKKFLTVTTQEYVVQPGDTLSGIALRYNLNMDTIISFNGITNPRAMRVGQKYQIPNRDGLMYTVLTGDSLESLAEKFETTVYGLIDSNNLLDTTLSVGQKLFIPDARMNPTDLKMLLGELFMWPTVGRFTSGYGYRSDPFTGQRRFHNGIDLANSIGTSVKAALAGRVVAVESQLGNYGKVVIIQHPRGFQTLYAHLNSFNVKVGQSVSAGQLIGRMGNTGRSTGPHLHFSVILNGSFVNPLRYLK